MGDVFSGAAADDVEREKLGIIDVLARNVHQNDVWLAVLPFDVVVHLGPIKLGNQVGLSGLVVGKNGALVA